MGKDAKAPKPVPVVGRSWRLQYFTSGGQMGNGSTESDHAKLLRQGGVVDLAAFHVRIDARTHDARWPRLNTFALILRDAVRDKSRCVWSLPGKGAPNPANKPEFCVVLEVEDTDAERQRLGDEGYEVAVQAKEGRIVVRGTRERGVLFGLGRLLREMSFGFCEDYGTPLSSLCVVPDNLHVVSKPQYPIRGHQIAYRPKTNSYDAFTPAQMREEILSLALFGTNVIEMIPPNLDDAAQSPHFTVPHLRMLGVATLWCDRLDIDVGMWYPAIFRDYTNPETMARAKEEWSKTFSSMHRLNALFVPGGDPGGRHPTALFAVVKELAGFVRANFFPDVKMWVSSQFGLASSFDLGMKWRPRDQLEAFYRELAADGVQSFLDGVVYGPWSVDPIDVFRSRIPKWAPLRHYPDLCHCVKSQYPVQNWDFAFATCQQREPITVRPRTFTRIASDELPITNGSSCYSEGVSDDVNKYVWCAMLWGADHTGPLHAADPTTLVRCWLEQYCSLLCLRSSGAVLGRLLTDVAFGLEDNWVGPILQNRSIGHTFSLAQFVESRLSPQDRWQWRVQMLLFRAYHDMFLQTRALEEAGMERAAMQCLRFTVAPHALGAALRELERGYHSESVVDMCEAGFYHGASSHRRTEPLQAPRAGDTAHRAVGPNDHVSVFTLYSRLQNLAGSLYQAIGLQLTTEVGVLDPQRGGFFDLSWTPVGDVQRLRRVIKEALASPRDAQRLVDAVRFHHCPEGCVWYGNFGEADVPGYLPQREVVVSSRRDLGEDGVLWATPLVDYADSNAIPAMQGLYDGEYGRDRRSWLSSIWPQQGGVELRFPLFKLPWSPAAPTTVRVTYIGHDLLQEGADYAELDRCALPTRMTANGVPVHDFLAPLKTTQTMEFEVPAEALLQDARELVLRFEPHDVSAVTVAQVPIPVAELWLIQKPSVAARL